MLIKKSHIMDNCPLAAVYEYKCKAEAILQMENMLDHLVQLLIGRCGTVYVLNFGFGKWCTVFTYSVNSQTCQYKINKKKKKVS